MIFDLEPRLEGSGQGIDGQRVKPQHAGDAVKEAGGYADIPAGSRASASGWC